MNEQEYLESRVNNQIDWYYILIGLQHLYKPEIKS